MYQIFEQAEQQLAAAGVTLTESAWTDPHQFSMFVDSVTDVAGCTDSEAAGLATSAQALHNGGHGDGTDDYCGPGHGVILPNVDPCLNEACRQHDGCYGQCSAKISLQCSWSKSTAPCDDPFMAAANACEIRVNPFRSHAVLWLARKFYNSTLLDKCAPGVWCPSPPALGPGPCGAGANASLCFDCLGQVDPGLACRESACADNPFDATCYTANCPNVGACYGGWGAGSGGSGGTGGTGATGGTSGTGGTGATGGTSGAGGVCSTVEEPNETEFAASDLGTIGDCDSSGGSLQAALSGSGDVDYFYFYGVDTFGCVVDPYASIDVANTQICLFSDCTVGCTTGTGTLSETSRQGCCSNTGAVQLSANCSGTNDSTGVYVRIQQLSGNACLPYTMDYSF